MKKILYAALLLLSLLTLGSCRDTPINGKLDGYWQLVSITDDSLHTENPPAVPAYMGLYRHTFNLVCPGHGNYSGNLTYDRDKMLLTLDLPMNGDASNWGLPPMPFIVTLKIEQLDHKTLVLKLDDPARTMVYRRY